MTKVLQHLQPLMVSLLLGVFLSAVQEDDSVLKILHRQREEGGENMRGFWHKESAHLKISGCLTPGGCCGNWGS